MPTLIPRPGFMPRDIEGFPPKSKRSAPGALHLAPGVAREITDDELNFLGSARPDVMGECDLLTPPVVHTAAPVRASATNVTDSTSLVVSEKPSKKKGSAE